MRKGYLLHSRPSKAQAILCMSAVSLEPLLFAGEKRISIALITKTYLYNFDPLKPHFYIVKLGFAGV